MSKFLGVDPGISGAVAVLDSVTKEVWFYDTPVVTIKQGKNFKNTMDCHTAANILQSIDPSDGILITIEKVNAMPSIPGPDGVSRSMGVTSSFNFGMNFGMWIGICAASQIPYQLVHPATWKALLMRDMAREKDASRVKAMQLYPYTAKDLARKKDHARADALLLAHYGLTAGTGQAPAKVRRLVVQNALHEAPLLFGGSSVQMPRQRVVEEEEDPLGEF